MNEQAKPMLLKTSEVGRPSPLDDLNLNHLKKLILQDKKDYEICDEMGINRDTFQNWKIANFRGFNTFYQQCVVERMLNKAMKTIESIASMTIDPDNDPRIMKIIYDANALVLERANQSLFRTVKEDDKQKNKAVNLKISSYAVDKDKKMLDNKKDVAQSSFGDNNITTESNAIIPALDGGGRENGKGQCVE